MMNVDSNYIPQFIAKIERECIFEGVRHEPSFLANTIPILNLIWRSNYNFSMSVVDKTIIKALIKMDISGNLFKSSFKFQILGMIAEPEYIITENEALSILTHVLELMGDDGDPGNTGLDVPIILSNAIKEILTSDILNFDENLEFSEHIVETLIKYLEIQYIGMVDCGAHDEDTSMGWFIEKYGKICSLVLELPLIENLKNIFRSKWEKYIFN